MKFLKISLGIIVSLVVILIVSLVTLYTRTMGEYPMVATVLDDPALAQIDIAGVRLHAESFGDVANPTLVVIHGGPGADYRSLLGLKSLSDQYHVVFYDQRGAGLSQRVSSDALSMDAYLDELDTLIDAYANGQPVTLIGHSWGAMLATAYMGKASEKISRAVLMEPGFFNAAEMADWDLQAKAIMSEWAYIKTAIVTGFEAQHVRGPDSAAIDDYLIGKMAHVFADQPDNPYHCPDQPYDAPSWRFGSLASQSAKGMYTADVDRIEAGARQFTKPVLLLASTCNSWLGKNLQETHRLLFTAGQLTIVPDAGHDMVWDNRDATLTAIRTFLTN